MDIFSQEIDIVPLRLSHLYIIMRVIEDILKVARTALKRGFLIGSRRSRGGVSGPSPIWLKLGRVTRGNIKSCQETLFWRFIACRVI